MNPPLLTEAIIKAGLQHPQEQAFPSESKTIPPKRRKTPAVVQQTASVRDSERSVQPKNINIDVSRVSGDRSSKSKSGAYKVEEMKQFARQLGVNAQGSKAELASRILTRLKELDMYE